MRRLVYVLAFAFLAVGVTAMTPRNAAAQWRFGPEVAWGQDTSLGIGARATTDIDAFSGSSSSKLKALRGIADFIYYTSPFDNCDSCSFWEANVNGAIPLAFGENDFYVGAGLNIAHSKVDYSSSIISASASSTDIGANVLGGLNFVIGKMAAFAEAGYRLNGGDQFVVSGGLLFGGGGMDGGM